MGITPQQFEQLKNRVGGKRSPAAELPAPVGKTTGAALEIVLGVDPSLRGTGYGVIRASRTQPELIAQGTIHCPATWHRSRCLAKISQTLREVLQQTNPTICVIEGLFFAQNLQTALIMGEARGAALATIAEAGLEIYELAPRKVKQAIVGYGAAQKLAVAKMVQRMLQLAELPEPDAADALALALAHTQTVGKLGLQAPKKI